MSRGQRRPRADFFDRWSETYDGTVLQRLTYRPLHDAVVDVITDRMPELVVDLGCGTGLLTERLSGELPSAAVVGIDYSEGMARRAHRRLGGNERISVVRADATHLPLADNSVDLVTCTESFHWYPDQAGTLVQLRRALHPDGLLVIGSVSALGGLGQRAIERVSRAADQPIRALTADNMTALLERTGFRVVSQRRVFRPSILLPLPLLSVATPALNGDRSPA